MLGILTFLEIKDFIMFSFLNLCVKMDSFLCKARMYYPKPIFYCYYDHEETELQKS